jgi:glycosyltransferase involved in cell wall biosynthesis
VIPKRSPRVVIIQWYIPQYRESFYEGLRCDLAKHGVELVLGYGTPPGIQADRSDALDLPWATPLLTKTVRLGGRTIEWRRLGSLCDDADLIIVEQAIKNIETYPLLLKSALGGARVAMWGHGRTYTKRSSKAAIIMKRQLTRRAHWFFAYTQGGARAVIDAGFPVTRVTVVQNATDTRRLVDARLRLSAGTVDAFRQRHGISASRVGVFLGGLDSSKRLPFLFEACNRMRRHSGDFQLVIAGAGPEESLVRSAVADGWVKYVGPMFGDERALLGAVGDILMMPGRVGLAVLDAFALGLPIVTTEWPFHAPEFEYVEHGHNGWITINALDAFCDGVLHVLSDEDLLASLKRGATGDAERYTMDEMVHRFSIGIREAVGARESWADKD